MISLYIQERVSYKDSDRYVANVSSLCIKRQSRYFCRLLQ